MVAKSIPKRWSKKKMTEHAEYAALETKDAIFRHKKLMKARKAVKELLANGRLRMLGLRRQKELDVDRHLTISHQANKIDA